MEKVFCSNANILLGLFKNLKSFPKFKNFGKGLLSKIIEKSSFTGAPICSFLKGYLMVLKNFSKVQKLFQSSKTFPKFKNFGKGLLINKI
ncbi:hypothetical protein MMU07_12970 [Aquiflexum sp. LQ15W]|nr:hypothetical protein [Cognataquiflexum nitidum]